MPDSPPPQRTLTRQSLYELVWARPIGAVAADLDLEPTALRRLCIEHNVPRPRSGHWSRVRAGHLVPPPGLAPASREDLELVSWRDPIPPKPPGVDDAKLAAIQVKAERLLASTRAALRSGPPDHRGLRATSAPGSFVVAIDEANVERVLEFLGLLSVDLQRRGVNFAEDDTQRYKGLVAVVAGERVPFSIKEIVHQRSTHAADGAPDFVIGEDGFLSPPYIYSPTGRLVLHIGDPEAWGLHARLREGKRLLDARLSEASLAFFVQARLQAERRDDRARTAHEAEEHRRRLDEERVRREVEAAQERSLLAAAVAWDRARLLRQFIAATTRDADKRGLQPAEQVELQEWKEWALRIAHRLDPLAQDAPWAASRQTR